MEKKISFGFSKISKKNNILPNKLILKDDENKIELIKGLEGQSIQLVVEKVEEAPLVIPLKDGGKTSAALLSLKTRQAVLNGEEIPIQKEQVLPANNVEQQSDENQSIEKRAAKELLAELSKSQDDDGANSNLVLPVKSDELPLDGAKESTIEDYDSIPIRQFGFAMLRGMGWKEEPKKAATVIDDGAILRPKGMGLGADKALKPKALLVAPEANEVLEIKKGAFVKVLGGKHKDLYGQIEGLDDHAGRVIAKMALGGTKESFNEFMVQVVSKKEYAQYSKCINSAKYDEYKRRENAQGQIIPKKEESIKKESNNESERNHKENSNHRNERSRTSPHRNGSEQQYDRSQRSVRRSRSRERWNHHSSSSTSNKKYTDRHSPRRERHRSGDSASSDSSSHRSKHKKSSKKKKSKKSKDKSHDRRPSTSSTDEDRQYKKKTKKSKRGRSRSRSRR